MNLTIEMPWERDLSVNHMRFGARGGYRKKPHVQAWMNTLYWCTRTAWQAPFDEGGWERMEPQLPLEVFVAFRYPDRRRRDSHNYFKCLCDPIADALHTDDQHIRISTKSVTVDGANAGFTIEITDEEGE